MRLPLLLAALLTASPAHGQAAPAPAPPGAPSAPPSTQADATALQQKLQQAGAELVQVLGGPAAVLDPAARAENREEVVPAILKMRDLLTEGVAAGVVPPNATDQFDMMLAVYEHPQTLESLQAESGGDGDGADRAFGSLVTADAIRAEDGPARAAAVDGYADRAALHPDSEPLVGVGVTLLQLPVLDAGGKERVMEVMESTLTSGAAAQAVAALNAAKQLASLVGKPLVLEGQTADGGTFSTADWKGKVVLVDFWATWCAPCIATLPGLKETYARYHDQGLEILGVSCDASAKDVTSFVAEQDGMPWPHLFAEGQEGWHPLATEYGVLALPTKFLLDRKGIVRSVTAHPDYKTLIPQLLADAPAEGDSAAGGSAG